MEYFKFEYSKANKDSIYNNYEKYLLNSTIYKFYVFDLFLLRYDSSFQSTIIKEADYLVKIHKLIFFLPYPIFLTAMYVKYKQNFFSVKNYPKEISFALTGCALLVIYRLGQKLYLKYDFDRFIAKHSVSV